MSARCFASPKAARKILSNFANESLATAPHILPDTAPDD